MNLRYVKLLLNLLNLIPEVRKLANILLQEGTDSESLDIFYMSEGSKGILCRSMFYVKKNY